MRRTQRSTRIVPLLTVLLASVLTVACSDPPQEIVDEPDATDAGDGTATDGPKFEPNDAVSSSSGGTTVTLTFEVDDSANKTYSDADIYWTGSFEWDEKIGGSVKHTSSWLPEERAWPPLYDDGPISGGG